MLLHGPVRPVPAQVRARYAQPVPSGVEVHDQRQVPGDAPVLQPVPEVMGPVAQAPLQAVEHCAAIGPALLLQGQHARVPARLQHPAERGEAVGLYLLQADDVRVQPCDPAGQRLLAPLRPEDVRGRVREPLGLDVGVRQNVVRGNSQIHRHR